MSRISVFAITVALLGGLAAACGGDGQPSPTPVTPTTISVSQTTVETGEGEFRFTLELTNEGDNAAINVTTADVWQEGLEVTEIGSVEGQRPQEISNLGLQFTLSELEARVCGVQDVVAGTRRVARVGRP